MSSHHSKLSADAEAQLRGLIADPMDRASLELSLWLANRLDTSTHDNIIVLGSFFFKYIKMACTAGHEEQAVTTFSNWMRDVLTGKKGSDDMGRVLKLRDDVN